MDKFEKLIKDAVEGHEMPFDPQAWDNVSNELGDSFDQLMKESTSGYEAPYNPAAWDAVNHQLGPTYAAWKWIGGSAAVIAIVAGGSYLIDNSGSDSDELTNHVSNEVVINDNNNVSSEDTYEYPADGNNNIVSNDNNNVVDNGNDVEVLNEIDPELNHNNPEEIDDIPHSSHGEYNSPEFTVEDLNEENSNENNVQNPDNTNLDPDNNISNNELYDLKVPADFNMSVSEVCQGELCIFTPENIHRDLKYVWTFGDGSFSSATVGKHKFRKDGEFLVSLEIKDPRTNKTLGSKTESIQVNELPKVNFSWEQSSEVIPTVNFINLTDEATQWNWNIKGLKQSNKNEFEYTFRKAGNYVVELTATNDDGCTNSAQKTINIENDYNLLAPTAFSPDGDFKNDEFMPEALKMMDVEFTMTIHDKSGKSVFVTRSAGEPWDGRFTEDNIMAPSGSAYIWRVVLINNNGEQEMYEGQVFVIR